MCGDVKGRGQGRPTWAASSAEARSVWGVTQCGVTSWRGQGRIWLKVREARSVRRTGRSVLGKVRWTREL